MLAIRRVVNSCIQSDCDQSDFIDSNKENSKVRRRHLNEKFVWIVFFTLNLQINP